MQFCRFNFNRLGLLEDNHVFDVSEALGLLPLQWPAAPGDPLLLHLEAISAKARQLRPTAVKLARTDVTLHSPLTQPSKIMAAPSNYPVDPKDVDFLKPGTNPFEGVARPADKYALFLKAGSSLAGEAEGIRLALPARRTDYELELAVVIGKAGRAISRADAMQYIAGYTIALDLTLRGGEEDRSYRKSPDTYTVLGPALVTADEVGNPHDLMLSMWVNGVRRQHCSTSAMTVDIPDLIEIASRVCTLYPGDVILTGTPPGFGPLHPGDRLRAACEKLGEMRLAVNGNNIAPPAASG